MEDNSSVMEDNIRLTFPKSERLRHKSLVDGLFADGKKKFDYPLRMLFKTWTEEELRDSFKVGVPDRMAPLQVMITIPKRKIRHAVDRVLLRRRVREAWRLNRRALREVIDCNPEIRLMGVALVYMADEVLPMERIEGKVRKLIAHLSAAAASGTGTMSVKVQKHPEDHNAGGADKGGKKE